MPKTKGAGLSESKPFIGLTKADKLLLRKQSAKEYKKLSKGLGKRQRKRLREILDEKDKKWEAKFEDALQATLRAIEESEKGNAFVGKFEDPPTPQGRGKRKKSRRR